MYHAQEKIVNVPGSQITGLRGGIHNSVTRTVLKPTHMVGGIGNPLGARALYLGGSLYRIHGTNEPYSIGTSVSSGCIRMMNDDVIDLYGRVGVGTKVIVM